MQIHSQVHATEQKTRCHRGVKRASAQTRIARLLLLALCLVLTLGVIGCERSGKRVKMAKPPNPLNTKRHQSISGDKLATSRKALVRAAQLTVADAAAMLGGFVYRAETTYTYKKATRTLRLKETYSLEQRADGIFRARLTNNRSKGYEVRWVGEALYQKELYRPFRIISKEVAIAHRWQRRGYGRWRAIVGLFGTQLTLTNDGLTTTKQRSATRYKLSLSDTPQTLKLPTNGSAWGGAVPNNTRGAAAKLQRKLLNATGTVWIDQKSGIALKIDFTGSYRLTGAKKPTNATLRVKAGFASFGDPSVKAPLKIVTFKREPEPKDPFTGNNKPGFVQEPPDPRKKAKKPSRAKKRKRRRKR